MPISGLSLVLLAACCHATWNLFVKRINGGAELIWLFSTISSLLYLPLLLWVIIAERPEFGLLQIGFILGSALIHLGYFLLLQTGYRKGDLSLVYPVARATGPLLSSSFAVLVLGEVMTPPMAVGAAIIVFGVLMLSGGIKAGARRPSSSLAFGLSTGVLIGSYTVWDAYAVSILLVPPLVLDYATNISRAVLLAPIAHRRRALVRQHWRDHRAGVLAIAILSPLAYILVLYAMTFTPVAYVAPTRELSVVLSVLAGSILLGEGQLKWRLSWGMVIVCGTAILALSG